MFFQSLLLSGNQPSIVPFIPRCSLSFFFSRVLWLSGFVISILWQWTEPSTLLASKPVIAAWHSTSSLLHFPATLIHSVFLSLILTQLLSCTVYTTCFFVLCVSFSRRTLLQNQASKLLTYLKWELQALTTERRLLSVNIHPSLFLNCLTILKLQGRYSLSKLSQSKRTYLMWSKCTENDM